MKKFFKVLCHLVLWGGVVPVCAGFGIMTLWNMLMPSVCGVGAVSLGQSVGLFFLGQLLSGGFIAGVFLFWWGLHAAGLHPRHHGHSHWHEMSDEQRREFLEHRRQWFDMMHSGKNNDSDGRE